MFAVLLGVLTFFIRSRFGVEGVGFAILLAELSARFWDFLFRPRVYGMPSQPFRSLAMLPQILKQTFLRNKDAFLQTKNLVLKIVKKK